jgi:hypothetical protein
VEAAIVALDVRAVAAIAREPLAVRRDVRLDAQDRLDAFGLRRGMELAGSVQVAVSVTATASMPSSLTRLTRRSIRLPPSSSEYSL